MVEDFFTQGCGVDVGVYLGGGDVLMTQHGLNGPQVGTALEERRGETVAQGVGRNGLGDTRLYGLTLDHDEYHGAGEVVARSEEHTSELQSRQYLVCRLLLEKKKQSKHLLLDIIS